MAVKSGADDRSLSPLGLGGACVAMSVYAGISSLQSSQTSSDHLGLPLSGESQADLLESGEERRCRVPDFHPVDVVAHELFKMRYHGSPIRFYAFAGRVYALGDVDDDTREAVLVDVDLLVIWYFSQCAVSRKWS
jgi:hypothetical protein